MAEYSGMGAGRKGDRATERHVASRGVYRTERLRLVPIGARHASVLWELHQEEGIARWYPLGREQARRFAERMESSWRRGVGKWLAYEEEESGGAFVGRGGPSWAVLEGAQCVEIGWALRREAWGRGYATEIGRAGLEHAFWVAGVEEEVVAFTEAHNARSRGVMERLGMRYVGQVLRPGFVSVVDSSVDQVTPLVGAKICGDHTGYKQPQCRGGPAVIPSEIQQPLAN